MKKFILACFVINLISALTAWSGNRAGEVTMEFDLSAQPADQVVRLWIPYPVSSPDQVIRHIRLDGNPVNTGVYTVPANGTPPLFAEWPEGSKSRKLTLAFEVTRDELNRGNLPTKQLAWNSGDYAEYLAPTSIGPTDGAVKELADNIVAGKPLDFYAPKDFIYRFSFKEL